MISSYIVRYVKRTHTEKRDSQRVNTAKQVDLRDQGKFHKHSSHKAAHQSARTTKIKVKPRQRQIKDAAQTIVSIRALNQSRCHTTCDKQHSFKPIGGSKGVHLPGVEKLSSHIPSKSSVRGRLKTNPSTLTHCCNPLYRPAADLVLLAALVKVQKVQAGQRWYSLQH